LADWLVELPDMDCSICKCRWERFYDQLAILLGNANWSPFFFTLQEKKYWFSPNFEAKEVFLQSLYILSGRKKSRTAVTHSKLFDAFFFSQFFFNMAKVNSLNFFSSKPKNNVGAENTNLFYSGCAKYSPPPDSLPSEGRQTYKLTIFLKIISL